MTETRSNPSPFSSKNLILPAASLLIGIITGLIGYLIGQFFYMLFVFPLILLGIAALLYLPILKYFRTASLPYNVFCGVLLGVMIFTTFHYVGFTLFRAKMMHTFEVSQNETAAAARESMNAFLHQKTGLTGFPGYMRYELQQFQPYVYYTTKGDGVISHSFVVYLHGKNSWLYLGGEAAVLLGGAALLGLLAGSRLFARLKLA